MCLVIEYERYSKRCRWCRELYRIVFQMAVSRYNLQANSHVFAECISVYTIYNLQCIGLTSLFYEAVTMAAATSASAESAGPVLEI